MTENYTTPTQTKDLALVFEGEELHPCRPALKGYTISNRGVIYGPEGNEMTPTLYRGRPVVGINGYMVFYDFSVAKLFLGQKRGYYIRHKDGDLTNCDVDNLEWRKRSGYKEKEEERGWIRRFDVNTCEVVGEYATWGEVLRVLSEERPTSDMSHIKKHLREALRNGDEYLGSYWRASSPEMLGRCVRLAIKTDMPTPKQKPAPKKKEARPDGWIKRFTPDGILVREYLNADQLCYEVRHLEKISQRDDSFLECIRRNVTTPEKVRSVLGSTWEVSDLTMISAAGGISYEGQQLPTLMEYTPASKTWIKRYCGPWLVQTFENIDEAVEYIMQHSASTPLALVRKLRSICGTYHTMLGTTFVASGEDALVSDGRFLKSIPKEEPTPAPEEAPQPQQEEPTPAPTIAIEAEPTKFVPTSVPSVEVEVEGFGDNVNVAVQLVRHSVIKIRITAQQG